ncbi:MAG: restriction endonuclease [Treponemataceae bacterium]|nr:restriction endonuclease [Treponemataceae bacterium]
MVIGGRDKMQELKEEEVKNIIAEFTSVSISRKELIKKCIDKLGLSKKILKDNRPGGDLNKIKCQFGNAVTELLKGGILIQDEEKLRYNGEKTDKKTIIENVKRDIEIEKIIFDLLLKSEYKRKDLLNGVANKLGTDFDKNVIKSIAGRLLNKAVENNAVVKKDKDTYCLLVEEKPLVETCEEKNARIFATLSDEELVDKTILMFEKWFGYMGYSVKESRNTDGPMDGGVDGIIKAVDGLDYSEMILIQVKNLHNTEKNVKLCDVREFCGVFSAKQEATKGIFVTNGKYHRDTIKFAKSFKTKYFVLVDGEQWLKLANECKFEV